MVSKEKFKQVASYRMFAMNYIARGSYQHSADSNEPLFIQNDRLKGTKKHTDLFIIYVSRPDAASGY